MEESKSTRPSGGTFGIVLLLVFILLPAFAIASGNNTAAAVATAVFFIDALAVYFAPAVIAQIYDHPNTTGIGILNFFLGWTVLGWVISLVWAFTGYGSEPQQAAQTKACPLCAEDVRIEAIKCKHCGADLSRSAAATNWPPTSNIIIDEATAFKSYGIRKDGDKYRFGDYVYDNLMDAVNYARKLEA